MRTEEFKELRKKRSNFICKLLCKLGFHLWFKHSRFSRQCLVCQRWQNYNIFEGWHWVESEASDANI